MSIGENIKKLRKEKGLTQKQLGNYAIYKWMKLILENMKITNKILK